MLPAAMFAIPVAQDFPQHASSATYPRKCDAAHLVGLAMGLAVALWGAGYKMEQYPLQGHAFRVMAPAKLLTEKERPARLDGLRIGPLPARKSGSRCVTFPGGSVPLLFHAAGASI